MGERFGYLMVWYNNPKAINVIHSHPTGRLSLERKNGLVLS
jgi:hypothetical protein